MRDRLLERLRAVPIRRLLVESDESSPTRVDSGLLEVLRMVAEARDMSLEEAAAEAADTFRDFYGTCLEHMPPPPPSPMPSWLQPPQALPLLERYPQEL